MELNQNNKAIIDLEDVASPAVLAGILDIPVPMVYQARQDGKLPPKVDASYRQCIQRYIDYYKSRVNARATSMSEAKLEQDIRNGIAKEHIQWLEVKQAKQELLELKQLKELFEPVFHIIKSSLVNLARQHPEITNDIDNMLDALYQLGEKIETRANEDGDYFVKAMLDKQINFDDLSEKLKEKFGIENAGY